MPARFSNQQEPQGRWRTLLAWGEAALPAARTLGDHAGEAFILSRLGMAHHNLGDTAQALICHQQSLALARVVGDQELEGRALGNLGITHHHQGKACWATGTAKPMR